MFNKKNWLYLLFLPRSNCNFFCIFRTKKNDFSSVFVLLRFLDFFFQFFQILQIVFFMRPQVGVGSLFFSFLLKFAFLFLFLASLFINFLFKFCFFFAFKAALYEFRQFFGFWMVFWANVLQRLVRIPFFSYLFYWR